MRIFVTGEKGFIGKNLINRMSTRHCPVDDDLVDYGNYFIRFTDKREPCVHGNSIQAWQTFFKSENVDVVIHNAAVVGTDVVALNAQESTLTNVQGTYNI